MFSTEFQTSCVPFAYSGAPPIPSLFARAKQGLKRGGPRAVVYAGQRVVDFVTPRSVNSAVWRALATTVVYLIAHNVIIDTISHYKAAKLRASIDRELGGPLVPMLPGKTMVAHYGGGGVSIDFVRTPVDAWPAKAAADDAMNRFPNTEIRYDVKSVWSMVPDPVHAVNVSFMPVSSYQKAGLLPADILPDAQQLKDITALLGKQNRVLIAYERAADICVRGTIKVSDVTYTYCPQIMDGVGDAVEGMLDAKFAGDINVSKAVVAKLKKDMLIISDAITAEELRTPAMDEVMIASVTHTDRTVTGNVLRADVLSTNAVSEAVLLKGNVKGTKYVSAPATKLLKIQQPKRAEGNRPVQHAHKKAKQQPAGAEIFDARAFFDRLSNG